MTRTRGAARLPFLRGSSHRFEPAPNPRMLHSMSERLTFASGMPASPRALHDWHVRPGAFARLTPPWQRITLELAPAGLAAGTRAILRTHVGPFAPRWVAEHVAHVPPGTPGDVARFRDVLRSGPFARFEHEHRFEPAPGGDPGASWLRDSIEWALPFAPLSAPLRPWARASLQRAFGWRHRITAFDLASHRGSTSMNLVVSGSSGLVGSALVPFLTAGGHAVRRLVRAGGAASDLAWRPERGELDGRGFDGVDGVVHLAGESVAEGRWNAAKKQRILASRVEGTRLLAETLARCTAPPEVLVCASAVGFYGDRGDELLDESSALGAGFLADVCRQWEAAARPAVERGIRVVHLRLGVVLSAGGGALRRMLPPFRLGLGGPLGSGRQWMSFIALDDALRIVLRALQDDGLAGAVNAVAPEPVRNGDFARTLGRVLGRPAFMAMPTFAARLVFGEVADELLLSSQRAVPRQLQARGHEYGWPTLESALRHNLGR